MHLAHHRGERAAFDGMRATPDDGSTRMQGALEAIEHATLWVERPVRRIAGSHRLNPLPHAGTISVFLLGLVTVTGLYITLFFEFGHDASYASVAGMEQHAIQKVARALHRYASAALVLTTVVHAWRIFATGRFSGRLRRWRWATGVSALVLVWLAGVTGYWLVWDVRAQAINEITIGLVAPFGWGAGFAVHQLSGTGQGSGSGFLLLLWFVHLGLTAVIGWFMLRHLRRSAFSWLPPRHWMVLMGGALLLVSLALPVGMLAPAEPDRLVADMPLDPFVLFLLPPLLSDGRWLALAIAAVLLLGVLLLPRLLRRSDPVPIVITEEACTGCDLCAVDCPYDALTMISRPGASEPDQPTLAVVDESRCVACGICVGSCAFGAIELPGVDPRPMADVAGRRVLVTCDRHLAHSHYEASDAGNDSGPGDDGQVVVPVRCAGMFDPTAVRGFMDAGATGVQLVGCPPNDCRYGVGNTLASERLSGERAPHPPRKFAASLTQDWVDPLDLVSAAAAPDAHPSADSSRIPGGREAFVGAGTIVAVSALIVAFATRAPFHAAAAGDELRVVIDHRSGNILQLENDATTGLGPIDAIEVEVDGAPLASATPSRTGEESVGVLDWTLPSTVDDGSIVEVLARSGETTVPVYSGPAANAPGRRLLVTVVDVPSAPGVDEGREVFSSRAAGCTVCHSTRPNDDGVGPTLAGVGSVAADRVEGLNAELYLRQSILLPDQYIVEGWPSGQMLPIYRERLTPEELDSLIVYLLSLTTEEEN